MITATTFEKIKEGDTFVFENFAYTKQKGTIQPHQFRTKREAFDYNAVDTKNGDFWDFDPTDEVLLIESANDGS